MNVLEIIIPGWPGHRQTTVISLQFFCLITS